MLTKILLLVGAVVALAIMLLPRRPKTPKPSGGKHLETVICEGCGAWVLRGEPCHCGHRQ